MKGLIRLVLIAIFLASPSWLLAQEVVAATSSTRLSNAPMININLATIDQIITLKGIGVVKAKAIVEYRDLHGSFDSFDTLMKVHGVGKKTISDNQHRLKLK